MCKHSWGAWWSSWTIVLQSFWDSLLSSCTVSWDQNKPRIFSFCWQHPRACTLSRAAGTSWWLSFSPLHSHTYPPSLDPGIKTTFESVYSTDNREHLHTSEQPDDIPGTSGLSYCPRSHSYPPPLYPTTFASSTLSPTSDQSFGQPPPLPPPLVSTGSLVQQVSMSYAPSANVLYAPIVSMQQSGSLPDKEIFWLYFVKGNISRCNGCGKRDLRGDDGRPRPPPFDLCIQHREYVLFENPRTGMHQMS